MSVSDSECQLPFMFFNCHFICILHNIFRISTYFPSVNNHFQRVRTENRIIFTKIPPKIVGCCFIAVKIKHFDVTCHEGFGLNPSHLEFTLNSSIPSWMSEEFCAIVTRNWMQKCNYVYGIVTFFDFLSRICFCKFL